jgi:hypothetical protein
MMPRIRRMKCVIGRISAIHCAGHGIPAYGNMKPDSRICGRNVKNAICIDWNCVWASVEMNTPSASEATMKTSELV